MAFSVLHAEATRDLFISLTPLALFLSMAAIIAFHQAGDLKKEIIVFAAIFSASFLIEAWGVNTGRVFGNYTYGEGLWIKILSTPLLIGINWVLLVYCTAVITDSISAPVIVKILSSSVLMVLYDLIMEQVAPAMNMWSFENGYCACQKLYCLVYPGCTLSFIAEAGWYQDR